jgi:Bacterial regulatory helix-turn-helix proteins, AraC family
MLLLTRNVRIAEIAIDLGFTSITSVNRTFKQLAGQSPSDYRDTPPKDLKGCDQAGARRSPGLHDPFEPACRQMTKMRRVFAKLRKEEIAGSEILHVHA